MKLLSGISSAALGIAAIASVAVSAVAGEPADRLTPLRVANASIQRSSECFQRVGPFWSEVTAARASAQARASGYRSGSVEGARTELGTGAVSQRYFFTVAYAC